MRRLPSRRGPGLRRSHLRRRRRFPTITWRSSHCSGSAATACRTSSTSASTAPSWRWRSATASFRDTLELPPPPTAVRTSLVAAERGRWPTGCSTIFEDRADAARRRSCSACWRALCGIEFKYSVVDSGTGRELQNRPIHNIAGLGESSGDRPFRPLAKPMLFMPRSTIRIEIEEISEGPIYTGAQLFIVLHGYKMLGYGTQP